MKPISRVNPATEENPNQNRSNTAQEREASSSIGRSDFGEAINGFTTKAQEIASDAYAKAQEYGGQAVEQTGSFIRRYPAQTLLAGFGAGLLLGLVVSRR